MTNFKISETFQLPDSQYLNYKSILIYFKILNIKIAIEEHFYFFAKNHMTKLLSTYTIETISFPMG
jgi:hypothetical protein